MHHNYLKSLKFLSATIVLFILWTPGCDDGGSSSKQHYACGDGKVDPGEECDSGELMGRRCEDFGFRGGLLGCTQQCTYDFAMCNSEICGNGVIDSEEQCNDATANSDEPNASCRTNCRQPYCGDGIVDTLLGELCDDGTANSDLPNAYCRTDCTPAGCGDGIVDDLHGEQCDGTNLPVTSCADLNSVYTGGALVCLDTCRLDYSDCEGGSCGNGIIEADEGCDDGNGTQWDGCNQCSISEFQVNTYTIRNQWLPAVAMAPDGHFVVVWQSYRQDGAGSGVYAQLYTADGSPAGAEFRVNTHTVHNQTNPKVAMASDGRFVVVWASDGGQDGSGSGIYAQRYAADGNRVGNEFLVNTYTANDQTIGDVAMAPDGYFVVVWTSDGSQDGAGSGVYAQRYTPDGNRVGSEFLVNTATDGNQRSPALAMASDRRFVVVWTSDGSQDGSYEGIFGQMYDASGIPAGGEFLVNTATDGNQRSPDVAMAPDGHFVVVWLHYGNSIRGQYYEADGSRTGVKFTVASNTMDQTPSVMMGQDAHFVMVWPSSNGCQNGNDNDLSSVCIRRYMADGNPVGDELQVNRYIHGYQHLPNTAMAPDGRFVVAWTSQYQENGQNTLGVFAQRYTPDGTPIGSLPWP